MRVYKIYDPKTGLYKNRGYSNHWSKKGSVWNGIGPLKNHLRLEVDLSGKRASTTTGTDYEFEPHWEIHEYDLVQELKGHPKIGDFLRSHPTLKR